MLRCNISLTWCICSQNTQHPPSVTLHESRTCVASCPWPVVLLSGSGVAANSLFNNLALMQIIAGLAPLKQIREVPVCLCASLSVCHLVNDGSP